ncbi:MAG: SPOR domain-containing protein [bacterium]
MAQKGVNLLDDDDDSDEGGGEEDFGDLDDDLDAPEEGGTAPKKKGKGGKGGGLIRLIGIAVAVILLLGGGSWAGYQYWWLPRLEKERKRIEAKLAQEKLAKENRLKARRAARERKRRQLALLKEIEAETEERAKGISGKKEGGAPEGEKAEEPAKPAAAVSIKPQVVPVVDLSQKKPVNPCAAKRPSAAAAAAKAARKRTASAAPAPARVRPSRRRAARKAPAPPARPAAKRKRPPAPAPKVAPKGTYYSVQVATCRTERCVKSFVSKLRAKGFEAFVTPRRGGRTLNDVLLGKFSSRDEAEAIVALARQKKIKASVYRAGGVWRVSAGTFSDLENAAQRLDQVEDAGLRGELASRSGGKTRFQTVRTGRLTRGEALALRGRVARAGFSGSFLVRQSGPK